MCTNLSAERDSQMLCESVCWARYRYPERNKCEMRETQMFCESPCRAQYSYTWARNKGHVPHREQRSVICKEFFKVGEQMTIRCCQWWSMGRCFAICRTYSKIRFGRRVIVGLLCKIYGEKTSNGINQPGRPTPDNAGISRAYFIFYDYSIHRCDNRQACRPLKSLPFPLPHPLLHRMTSSLLC